jgi:hypothetical protein
MPAIVNFGYFEVQDLDDSEINFAEVIAISPFLHFKRNDGYGFNAGDFKYVPSQSLILDCDLTDMLRWTPVYRPAGATGF